MDNNQVKKKRASFIIDCVAFALSTAAFVFYVYFLIMTVMGIIADSQNSDLGTGLQKALGMIFSLMSGSVVLLFSFISIIISKITLKKYDVNSVSNSIRVFLILSIVYILVFAVSFIVLLIFLN